MGPEQDRDAVADAGPLIHLSQIGAIALLRIFSAVHIPDGVWAETVGKGRVQSNDLESAADIHRHNVDAQSLQQFAATLGTTGLHAAETECPLLCRDLPAPLLLTDDMAAREAAQRQGVRPVGSLGVAVRAFYCGQIPLSEAERCIRQLFDVSSLFVTKAIVDLAIEQLRQQPT